MAKCWDTTGGVLHMNFSHCWKFAKKHCEENKVFGAHSSARRKVTFD